MTRNDKYDDDDYVAKLLAEDAKKSSHKYAAVGLSALLRERPSKGVPKPNTRFLTHLVREVDSHNAALKKKEELEARIRLKEMKARESKRERDDESDDGERDDKKRRRTGEDHRRSHLRKRSRERSRDRDRKKRNDRSRSRSPQKSRSHGQDKTSSKNSSHKSRKAEATAKDDREKRRHKHKHKYRSRSRERNSKPRKRDKDQDRDRLSPPPSSSSSRSRLSSPSDNTPNPASIADKPSPSQQPRIRGRGFASKSASNIDAHFSSTYDPALDINPTETNADQDREGEDWDMALEALRDRAMWKRKQADRMRDAGFGDEEIRRWEKSALKSTSGDGGGADVDIRNVKWKRKGEEREWDSGKVLDDD